MENILDDFQEVEPTKEMLRWRQFIGKSANFYIERWIRIEYGDKISFNFAAFLFGAFWFLYRKMYLEAFIVMIFFAVKPSITNSFIDENSPLNLLFTIITGTVLGFTGNLIYYHSAKRKINRIVAASVSEETALVSIAKRGGTSKMLSLIHI